MNKSRLSIILIALMVSSLVLFGTVHFGKAQSTLVAPTVTPAPVTVDQGQTSALTSTAVTTGVSPYTYQWFAKAPGKSYAKVGTSSTSYNFITSVSNATGSWSFILQVTDSTGVAVNSTAVSVTVDSALVAPTVKPAPVTVDQGQTSVLSSSAVTTGSGSYTYQWFDKASSGSYAKTGTGSTSYNFVTANSTTAGSWSFILQVTDSIGAAVNSTAATVTVNSALVASSASASFGTVDQGQTSVLSSSTVSAGVSPYTYQWFAKAPGKSYAKVGTNSLSYSFVTSNSTTTGSWSFIFQVTDSTGVAVNSTAVSVTVDSALVAPTVKPAPVTVDQGQTSVLSSSAVTTGSGSYTYQWFAKAPSGSYAKTGTNSTSYKFIASVSNVTGSWSFILQVTDSTGASVNSTVALVTVNARPLLFIWASDLLIAIVIAVLLIIILFAWRKHARKMGRKKNQPANVAVEVTKVEIADNSARATEPIAKDVVSTEPVAKEIGAEQVVKGGKKQKGVQVSKVEVSDNIVRFFAVKGFFRKQLIVVKEIPLLEIEHIEKFGKELSVTWKGATYTFFSKEKTDLFSKLVDQVNGILEEDQRKFKENEEKAALRGNELLGAINASVGIIDSSFDILIGLQVKRINWERLEGNANDFGKSSGFAAQTMPPLNMDFAKIAFAIKTQSPKETTNEVYSILKATYGYFNGLSIDIEFKDNHPNFNDAKALISAYLMLNDLLLGKVVGDKENNEEISQLESVLQNLAAETNFKVDIEELKNTINKIDVNSNKENVIERSREIFKQQLKQQLKPKEKSLTTTQGPRKVEVTEPVPTPKVEVTEPVPTPKVEVTEPVPTPKVEVTEPVPTPKVEVTEPVPTPKVEVTEPVPTPKVEVTEPVPTPKVEVTEPVPTPKVEVTEPVPTPKVEVTEPVPTPKVEVTEPVPTPKVEVSTGPVPIPKAEEKQKRIEVSKVEVSDNIVKFFAVKGFFRKQWIVVKEIPLLEIEHIEKFGKELSVTWKGATYTFFSKEKTDLFSKLVDQVNGILEGVGTEPVAPPVNAEPVAKSEVVSEPVAKSEVVSEPVAKSEVVSEPVAKEKVSTEPVSNDEVAQPAVTSPEDNQPAPATSRRRGRRSRSKQAPPDSSSEAQS